jgi:hypothetical protein
MTKHELVGKKYTFEDGNVLEVIQVKSRDHDTDGIVPYVTYTIHQNNNLPRKLVMSLTEFMNTYRHLFE